MPHLTLQYPGLPATRAGQRRGDAGRLPSRVESAFLGARLASPARAGRSPQQSLAIAASRDGSFGRTRKSSKGTPTAECEVAVKEIVATSPFYWDEPCDDLSKEFAYLEALKARLAACADEAAKVEVLRSNERVTSLLTGFSEGPRIASAIASLPVHMQLVLYALPAAGQAHILWVPEGMPDDDVVKGLRKLANRLVMVETFYSAIGGVVGYQHKMISLILESTGEACKSTAEAAGAGPAAFHLPCGTNLLDDDGTAARRSARAGLEALAVMGELYPLGGAGDRLGLKCEVTGEALPVALLPYAGRTLLEGLIRDVQAREYLHFRTLGVQHVTPVAIMTSKAKGNHQRLSGVCEGHGWFGRGEESFRLFRQPMVPLVGAEDGRWLLPKPFSPKLKPGGHGAIWKLMLDEGVFDWFRGQGRKATIVRQISNPMAGTDVTLLALAGTGAAGGKKFGFASCERPIGNAEGVNVLVERTVGAGRYTYGVSNVEYTEFDRIGLKDAPPPDKPDSTLSKFPANTNVLYVDCGAAEAIVANDDGSGSATLPGMIVNLKKVTKYTDCRTGEGVAVRAGRLECTMQNLADSMVDEFAAPLADEERDSLSTFVLYNKRSRVTSSAKRKLKPKDSNIHQTPEGSFLDLMQNAKEMLERCGVETPAVAPDTLAYLRSGPDFIFLFHPAMGPLWDVVAQKIRGGRLEKGSEVRLEVAEVDIQGLQVAGSLLVHADDALGRLEDQGGGERLVFSSSVGRVRIRSARFENAGVAWEDAGNVFWQARVARREACHIVLRGSGEIDIADCVVRGEVTFDVPDGHRMRVRAGPGGDGYVTELEPVSKPSWEWGYGFVGDEIRLSLK